MKRSTVFLLVALVVIAVAGSILAQAAMDEKTKSMRDELISQSELAALGINMTQMQALSGNLSDLGSTNYEALKTLMIEERNAMPHARFVYIVGQWPNGAVFFYVDSEPTSSADYSPPGQSYQEAADSFDQAFAGEIGLNGPLTDRWGTWMTAMVPLHDPTSGAVVAVLSVDVDAADWGSNAFMAGLPEVLASLLLATLMVIFVVMRSRKERETHQLAETAKELGESEEKHRLLIENSHDIIYTINPEGEFTFVSPSWTSLLGHPVDQVVGRPLQSFVHPDDLSICHAFLQKTIETKQRQLGVEYRMHHADGSWRWHTTNAVPLTDGKGKIVGLEGSASDITERKKAEEALRESVLRYELVMDGSSAGLWDSDVVNNHIHFSSHWKAMRGYTDDEIGDSEMEWTSRIHPDDAPRIMAAMKAHFDGQIDVYEAEYRVRCKDGSYIWVLDRGKAVRDATGKVIRNVGSEIDITDRKLAEEALLEIEHRFRSLFENMLDGLAYCRMQFDDQGRPVDFVYLDVNSAFESLTGLRDVIGKSVTTVIPGIKESTPELFEVYGRVASTGKSETFEAYIKPLNIWLHISANSSKKDYFISVFENITERKRIEKALIENEERIRLLLNSAAEAIYGIDLNGDCTFCNSSCLRLLRYEHPDQLLGKNMHWLIHAKRADGTPLPLEECRIFQAFKKGKGTHVDEEVLWRSDGTPFSAEYWSYPQLRDGEVIGAVVSFLDITERKKVEHQVTERMKELQAFYRLAEIAEREHLTLVELYQETTNLLPKSWQYPEIACARTVIGDSEFRTDNFRESPWKLSASVKVYGSLVGRIEVGYLEERPMQYEGPFMKEERRLIDAIAERIGHITGRKRIEEALKQANIKLGILSTITRHDINNQMMVLNGFLELAKRQEKDPDLTNYLEKISRAAVNVQEQIAFTKTYQELGIQEPAWASVGRRVTDAFATLHPIGVVLEDKTDSIEVLTDPLADKVSYNLIDNSMRHGGRLTRIKMSAEQVGNAMMIVYEDDGVGISTEDKKRLFQKGFGKNTGYGLFLIREILAITGITIVETGQPGHGVRFEMLVPPGAWRIAPRSGSG